MTRQFVPSTRKGVAFGWILLTIAAVRLLGGQGTRFGSVTLPKPEIEWLLGLVVLAFFLVPTKPHRETAAKTIAVLLLLVFSGWLVFAWRSAIVTPSSSLTAEVSRLSDSGERPGQTVLLDSLLLDERRYLNRLAGRRRDIGLDGTGFIFVPHRGTYKFYFDCDDACGLQINDLTVTPMVRSTTVPIDLEPGIHPLSIRYSQIGGPAHLRITWNRPSFLETLPLDHYVSGRSERLSAATLRGKEHRAWLSFAACLAWCFFALGFVLRTGENRLVWKQILTSGRAARWAPAAVTTLLVAYGTLLRFDALLVHSRLAIEDESAAAVHHAIRPLLPSYGLFQESSAPEDPYRADVRSYLDRASSLTLGRFFGASFREPFYIVLVQLFLALSGGRELGILIASAFFSVAVLPLVFFLVSSMAGRWWATAALIPLVLHEWLILEAPTGYRMSAYAFFILAFTGWSFLHEKRRWWSHALIAGVLAAAVCLIRLSALSFVLPLLLLRAWDEKPRRGAYAAVSFAVLISLVGPFLLSCYLAHGDPFYAVSFHTTFWLDAESIKGGPAGTVGLYQYFLEYHGWFDVTKGTLLGLTYLPVRTFWMGLARFPLLDSLVLLSGIVGLLLVLTNRYRFICLATFCHLIPFAYIQNFPSGKMPRFVMPAFFFFVLAGVYALWWVSKRFSGRSETKTSDA